MARKVSVPDIPPVPSPPVSRSAKAAGVLRSRAIQPTQSQEPELPDLLDAFWGDAEAASGAADRPG